MIGQGTVEGRAGRQGLQSNTRKLPGLMPIFIIDHYDGFMDVCICQHLSNYIP